MEMITTMIDELIRKHISPERAAAFRTKLLKRLSVEAHAYYGKKISVMPHVPVNLPLLNLWYTPGVSGVSLAIREDNRRAFDLSGRGNLVAVVSDSTRVLGDGNCTPPGGLGVMEGKALLMKYLGGVDAVALCMDSRDRKGNHDPERIINFVKMASPSFGAVNLEDISQPNCYTVLDRLRAECLIPVWHDDAQGTACVTLAALQNALKLAGKEKTAARVVFFGAGASNSSAARLLIADGFNPGNIILFDAAGALHRGRADIESDPRFYRQWELCVSTNPDRISDPAAALRDADALIAFSAPGPGVIRAEWIAGMAERPVVFACANPVPEIYPDDAHAAGAFITATGRGDFPNQVNNAVCFPGILKGALLARAATITDSMAIHAAHSIAAFAERRGINRYDILPRMDEDGLHAELAADVAMSAVREGISGRVLKYDEYRERAAADIREVRDAMRVLENAGIIRKFPENELLRVFDELMREEL